MFLVVKKERPSQARWFVVWLTLSLLFSQFGLASNLSDDSQNFSETFGQEKPGGSDLGDDKASIFRALESCDEICSLLDAVVVWLQTASGWQLNYKPLLKKLAQKYKLHQVTHLINSVKQTKYALLLLQSQIVRLPCLLNAQRLVVFHKDIKPGALRFLVAEVSRFRCEANGLAAGLGVFLEDHSVRLRLSDFSFAQIPPQVVDALICSNWRITGLAYEVAMLQARARPSHRFSFCVKKKAVDQNKMAKLESLEALRLGFVEKRQQIIKRLNAIGQEDGASLNFTELLDRELWPLCRDLDCALQRIKSLK